MADDHGNLFNLIFGLIIVFVIIIVLGIVGFELFFPVAHSSSGGSAIILKNPFQKLI